MRTTNRILAAALMLLGVAGLANAGVINVYVGYLNNLSGPPSPADTPFPFDPDASTILISSGGVATAHDTGVVRFENLSGAPITIDPGVSVTTQGAFFQIWDSFLPFVLGNGMNLVLAETANFNFDSSDFGLGVNPVVSFSINSVPYSATDIDRVLLGHEEAGNTAETTPYHLLTSVSTPEPATLSLLVLGLTAVGLLPRRKQTRA